MAVLDQVGRPGAVVLDPPHVDLGRVDVDPVVGEAARGRHDQGHREVVAVVQAVGGGQDLGRRGRRQGVHQLAQGHGRDHVRGGDLALGHRLGRSVPSWPVTVDDRAGPSVGHLDGGHRRLQVHRPPGGLHLLCADLPHHPRAVLGVLELLNEGGDLRLLALGQDGVDDRLAQVEVLDALGGPVGRHLGDLHAPDPFGVGLEEGAVEAPAEAGHQPVLVVVLVLRRPDAGPQVGEAAQDRLPQAQVAQGVHGLEGVVVVLPLVEDAAHAGAEEEVALGQYLVPECLHFGHLGEEAVAAEVEAVAVAHDGPADAAHDGVGLEDHGVLAPLGELVGRGEAPRPRPRDHHRCVVNHRAARYRVVTGGTGIWVTGPARGSGDRDAGQGTGNSGQGTEMLRKARRAYPARAAGRRVSTTRSIRGPRHIRAAAMARGKALRA